MSAPARTIGASDRAVAAGWRQTAAAYFALTKPRIIELLLVTTLPAMIVAAEGLPNLWTVLATLVGGSMAAGGASAINCYLDRDIDAIMQRTHNRPIPAGLIAPQRALIFGVCLSVVSFAFLTLTVNLLTALLASSAILFYVFIYTVWLKRSTAENIVIGGAAGAVPPLCGWAAVTGGLDAAPLIMFVIIFLWTPPHFWALAIGHASDYAKAGVPMLPVTHGHQEARKRSFVYALAMVGASFALYAVGAVGFVYLAVATVSGGAFLWAAWQGMRVATAQSALRLFRFSTTYLALLFAAMAIDQLIGL